MPTPSMTTGDAGGTLGGDTVKTVFNAAALRAFRANFIYRRLADVKWADGDPQRGAAVTFTIISATAPATTPLSETADPTPVNISDSQKTVTLVEYGNAAKTTKKLRRTSFVNLDLEVPQEMSQNMEESMDIIARDVLVAGTNVLYSGAGAGHTTRVTQAATDIFKAADLRRARAYLAGRNTPFPGGMNDYPAIGHPDVSYDLQQETGQQAWSAPHVYSDPEGVYTGEIGRLGGIRWIENANAKVFTDAGVTTTDIYVTIFAGLQALGEAVGEEQHMVLSGPFDDLQRFLSVGWYALEGFGRIRENSLLRFESASSIGVNT